MVMTGREVSAAGGILFKVQGDIAQSLDVMHNFPLSHVGEAVAAPGQYLYEVVCLSGPKQPGLDAG